jgi:hypothetical protein
MKKIKTNTIIIFITLIIIFISLFIYIKNINLENVILL